MSTSKLLKLSVAVFLVLFVLAVGSIVLFGKMNTANGNSLTLFKTIFFVFVLVLCGAIYLFNTDLLQTKTEHALIICSIIIFSAGVATMMGSIKNVQDGGDYAFGGAKELQAQLQAQNSYYVQQVNSMVSLEKIIVSNNRILENEVENLTQRLNKTPVIVETIVTIPGEIIYEEENSSTNSIEYEYEYEEEDD